MSRIGASAGSALAADIERRCADGATSRIAEIEEHTRATERTAADVLAGCDDSERSVANG